MPHYTPEEYAALLTRTYAPLCPRAPAWLARRG